jgi:hypothetical protein
LLLKLLVILEFLHYEFSNLRDFYSLEFHVDRLSFELQVLEVVFADIVEEGVVQGLGNGHSLVGIEFKRVEQKVLGLRCDCFKEVLERFPGNKAKGANVVSGSLIADKVDIFRSSYDVEDD